MNGEKYFINGAMLVSEKQGETARLLEEVALVGDGSIIRIDEFGKDFLGLESAAKVSRHGRLFREKVTR